MFRRENGWRFSVSVFIIVILHNPHVGQSTLFKTAVSSVVFKRKYKKSRCELVVYIQYMSDSLSYMKPVIYMFFILYILQLLYLKIDNYLSIKIPLHQMKVHFFPPQL